MFIDSLCLFVCYWLCMCSLFVTDVRFCWFHWFIWFYHCLIGLCVFVYWFVSVHCLVVVFGVHWWFIVVCVCMCLILFVYVFFSGYGLAVLVVSWGVIVLSVLLACSCLLMCALVVVTDWLYIGLHLFYCFVVCIGL